VSSRGADARGFFHLRWTSVQGGKKRNAKTRNFCGAKLQRISAKMHFSTSEENPRKLRQKPKK